MRERSRRKTRFSKKLRGESLNEGLARNVEPAGDVVVSVRLTEFGCRKTPGRIARWGSKRKEDAQ